MTFHDALPVLLVIAPAGVGVATYTWQERVKQRTALAQRKQEPYENLIGNLVHLLGATTGDQRSHLLTEIEKSWLFASDPVLRSESTPSDPWKAGSEAWRP
jgi:hypothetical protein